MTAGLRDELSSRLSGMQEAFASALGVKGANDRVDALTRFCRDLLRSSSLCLIDGAVHYFDGRIYSPAPDVRTDLADLLVDRGASPLDVRRMGDMPLSVIGEKCLAPSDALAFRNCIYDLSAGRKRAFGPEWVCTDLLPYDYSPSARCPRFSAFLDEVLPDACEQAAMLEFFSLSLLDRKGVSVEKMALFIGEGANGKSVVFDVVRAVLGGRVSSLDPAQLADDKMTPYLNGARINLAPDVKRSSAFESALKALSSGQAVTGRRIFHDAEQVCAPPLAFAMNDLPAFRDPSNAFFRRLLVFPFDVTIPEERQDKTLAATIISSELPGVMNLLLKALSDLRARRFDFHPTEKMRSRLEAIRGLSREEDSPVRAFLAKRGLSPTPAFPGQEGRRISQSEIVSALKERLSPTAVTRELRSFGVEVHRGREERYYIVYPIQKK